MNIIEKKESGCIQLPPGQRSWENICSRIAEDQQLVTMFSESYTPINCRSGTSTPLNDLSVDTITEKAG